VAQPLVVSNAIVKCSFGAAPAKLTALPTARVRIEGQDAAVITDIKAVANMAPFGMCSTTSNPAVASATSAANGVLTPQPCVPNVLDPWSPGVPTVFVGGQAAVNQSCQCKCAWGGVITVTTPGTVRTKG
jgi:hypothetical protein